MFFLISSRVDITSFTCRGSTPLTQDCCNLSVLTAHQASAVFARLGVALIVTTLSCLGRKSVSLATTSWSPLLSSNPLKLPGSHTQFPLVLSLASQKNLCGWFNHLPYTRKDFSPWLSLKPWSPLDILGSRKADAQGLGLGGSPTLLSSAPDVQHGDRGARCSYSIALDGRVF